jgi:hypothetical protein
LESTLRVTDSIGLCSTPALRVSIGQSHRTRAGGRVANGGWGRTIPDNLDSDMFGFSVTDFKDEINISWDQQMQIQQSVARVLDAPWNIIVSPKNQTISRNLWDGVLSTGGNVYVLDPVPITIEVEE